MLATFKQTDYLPLQPAKEFLTMKCGEKYTKEVIDEGLLKIGFINSTLYYQILRTKNIPVSEYLDYISVKVLADSQFLKKARIFDKLSLEKRLKLFYLLQESVSSYEGQIPPMNNTDKIYRASTRLQAAREDLSVLREKIDADSIGLRSLYLVIFSGFYDRLNAICEFYNISPHYVLGLSPLDKLYGKEIYTDSIVDYYYLIPDYMRSMIDLLVEKQLKEEQ